MKQNNILVGITFMIAGTFSLGVNDILVKFLTFGFPVWEIVFFRALSGVIISVFLVFYLMEIFFAYLHKYLNKL